MPKDMMKIAILLIFCLILPTVMPTMATATVGVKENEWIKWEIKVTAQGQSATTWIKITIQNVSGTQVTGTYEGNQPGWPTTPRDFTIDVATGSGFTTISSVPLIVSANLSTGELVPGTTLPITGTTTKDGRDAAYLNVSVPMIGTSTYYWDREKGVLLEFYSSYGGSTTLMKVVDTNMWSSGGLDLLLLVAIVVVVCIVVVVAAFLVIKRKPSTKTPEPPPPSEKPEE